MKKNLILILISLFIFQLKSKECANQEELKNINNQFDCSNYCAKKGFLPPFGSAEFKKNCSVECWYCYSNNCEHGAYKGYTFNESECKECPGSKDGNRLDQHMRDSRKDEITKSCCCG